MKTIQLTDEQYNALKNGESITLEPPKKGSWKPEWGQEFVYVGAFGLEHPWTFYNDSNDRKLLDFGNAFSSEENAKKASKAMRTHNRILQYIIENDSDWEADWNDRNQMKWFPWFDPYTDKWERNDTNCLKIAGCLYCSKKCCEELVELLNNGWLEEEDK